MRIQRIWILSTVDLSNDDGEITVGTNYLIVKDNSLKDGHNVPVKRKFPPKKWENAKKRIIPSMKLIFDIVSMKISNVVKSEEKSSIFREVNFLKVSE